METEAVTPVEMMWALDGHFIYNRKWSWQSENQMVRILVLCSWIKCSEVHRMIDSRYLNKWFSSLSFNPSNASNQSPAPKDMPQQCLALWWQEWPAEDLKIASLCISRPTLYTYVQCTFAGITQASSGEFGLRTFVNPTAFHHSSKN